ncbi:MAG TPA: DUF4293 domain-containing protein [Ohtaekwangia sp.]|nr:DUF4293 domain-containing protein [Ohtaekwangia sp.]
MWQRIQTVFLLVLIVSLIASIFLPIWEVRNSEGKTHVLYALHYSQKSPGEGSPAMAPSYLPYSLTGFFIVAAITIALIEIGKYKNRMLQMKLGALNSLFIAGAMVCAFYFANGLRSGLGGVFGFGLWLPGLAVVCNLVANQFIRRDERIVRDSQRLR